MAGWGRVGSSRAISLLLLLPPDYPKVAPSPTVSPPPSLSSALHLAQQARPQRKTPILFLLGTVGLLRYLEADCLLRSV